MDKVDLKPRRGGGVAGSVNPLLNLLVSSQTNNEPLRYPDYIDDVEILLQRIREQRPENTRILHGLAIIAEQKKRYRGSLSALPRYARH